MTMKLSIVIPLFNEEDNIKPLVEALEAALKGIEHEVILVDDGSRDATVARVRAYAPAHYRLIVLNRNYGQTTAMSAGIDAARGELIATLDGDLQNDPADIPAMIDKLESEQWDVVAGRRANRQDGMFLRKIPSTIANMLIRKVTGVYISDYGCTLKIFRNQVAKNLGLYGELHRFIPVLACMYGARMVEMDTRHHPRRFGVSKYGLGRTFSVFSDLLLMVFFQKYAQKPMHLFGTLGIILFLIGGVIDAYLAVVKIMGHDIGNRPLLFLGTTLILVGLQLVTTGFIAEFIMRTYYESQSKKPYVIKETVNGGSTQKVD